MCSIEQLFENNKAWAKELDRKDPGFFRKHAAKQA